MIPTLIHIIGLNISCIPNIDSNSIRLISMFTVDSQIDWTQGISGHGADYIGAF